MAVKIRLKRLGKIRVPQYRIVVVDERKKRDGRVIEEIGQYRPKEEPSFIKVESERVQYWLGVGAQPSDAVAAILKVTGDWQQFKGEPGAEGTLRTAEAPKSKLDIFNEALKQAANEPKGAAVTARSKKTGDAGAAEKTAEKPATEAAAEEPAAEAAEADAKATEETTEAAAEDSAESKDEA